MPISSFSGIETALRGLLAQQRAIEVTGHNIANESTPGYSRQRANLQASTPLIGGPWGSTSAYAQLGTGVDVTGIDRLRDRFADVQLRAQTTKLGEASTLSGLYEQVELSIAEPGDKGVAAQLGRLWSAWNDVANSPTSTAGRQVLLDAIRTTADRFATVDAQLATVQKQAAEEYESRISETGPIRQAVQEIAELNAAIGSAAARGEGANDLEDRRDLLLDQLSGFAQVRIEPTLDGSGQPVAGKVDVYLGSDTTPVVAGDQPRQPWNLAFGLGGPGSGSLGALASMASATGPIASYRQQLADAANGLADAVNALHVAAGGPPIFEKSTAPIVEGVARRPLESGTGIDPAKGGSLSAFVAGTAGGNEVATKIAALRNGPSDQAYRALVGTIGSNVADVRRQEATAQSLTDALQDRRDSISGVSSDEEMANLVRFQRGYQAAARTLTTVDELLDQLINRTGRVGL
ncbi:flagellar hook-associated protein FlgK [Patulibacter sp. SYSU D01012]|uniref:flagellar hook-associated protein FlgK n=1 Tax=Patulibacter sp. SYSU D01012 TaxID=2817381 RepID=UPI001B3081C9|nr:flagellar hook-associated protein FlgK [Patulibacter sp. SYSU D01012]